MNEKNMKTKYKSHFTYISQYRLLSESDIEAMQSSLKEEKRSLNFF